MTASNGKYVIEGHEFAVAPAAPGLHIVATPIGNLRDITLRALATLASVATIYCEDTRMSRRLTSHYAIATPLSPYHDHNAIDVRATILDRLGRGEALALISDAGMPLVSDPGYKLVVAARDAGYAVHIVPGASAVLTALAGAALPTDRFLFLGFPPAKETAARAFFADYARVGATLVLFESPKRAATTLKLAADVLGGTRQATMARELTKMHEEFVRLPISELATRLAATRPRGELVLLIGPPSTEDIDANPDVDDLLRSALNRLPPSKAAAEVARLTGRSRRDLFARALDLNHEAEAGE